MKENLTKWLNEHPQTCRSTRAIQGTPILIKALSALFSSKRRQMLLIQLKHLGRCPPNHLNKFHKWSHYMYPQGGKTLIPMSASNLATIMILTLEVKISTRLITSSKLEVSTTIKTTLSTFQRLDWKTTILKLSKSQIRPR